MREQVVTAETATDTSQAAAGSGPGLAAPEIGGAPEPAAQQPVALQDLLVEEVSIDGMCGVY